MKIFDRERIKLWRGLLATGQPEPVQHAERIVRMLRDVVLPAKVGLSLLMLYYLFYSGWNEETETARLALEWLRRFFKIYVFCNFAGGVCFAFWRRLPSEFIQWVAFVLGLSDGLFMAGVTSATGGFASMAFWVFPGLIVLNALSIPLATPQIVLNLLLSVFYTGAVILTPYMGWDEPLSSQLVLANMFSRQGTNGVTPGAGNPVLPRVPPHGTGDAPGLIGEGHHVTNMWAKLNQDARRNQAREDNEFREENTAGEMASVDLLSRISVMWLLTLCCYGTQVLFERQRRAVLEAAEFANREGRLHSAGRLAAEFVHQIKNPLAIINNAAYSLQRGLRDPKGCANQQIEIIQEEVARADKVITRVMGYAQLSEGRVERLNVTEEIERAGEKVFPGVSAAGIKFTKRCAGPFPTLLMQRGHLADILVNLLLNAQEALPGHGNVVITAACNADQAVEIVVTDDGPGISPDKLERIFEAYFTTKEKGTGLGLAIVKHNAELYGGKVKVESKLGQGARFTVILPAKLQPILATK